MAQIETSAVGLPMNAYTMGYYDGLYGADPLSLTSVRYMRGWVDGHAQWEMYLSMARGSA